MGEARIGSRNEFRRHPGQKMRACRGEGRLPKAKKDGHIGGSWKGNHYNVGDGRRQPACGRRNSLTRQASRLQDADVC